jgi:superfamily II DNA or RNA helicase
MATSIKNRILSRPLRQWQEYAKSECLKYFALGKRVWVQEAVTGAGKTTFAVETSLDYYGSNEVDLIIVLTPSLATLNGWLDSFSKNLNATSGPNYPADTQVWVSTYAGYKSIIAELGECNRRINGYLLIADEYHHAEREACWGQAVTKLGRAAKNVLMLSGTPWKTRGTIALVDEEVNIKGEPYYSSEGIIVPDNSYKYSKDLSQGDKDRATVPVHFTFVPAKTTDEKTGRTYELALDDPKDWRKYASKDCEESLGKYVAIDPNDYKLKDSDLGRTLIAEGFTWLNYSRSQIKQATNVDDLSIMLIVCRTILEAKTISSYVQNKYKVETEVIVSDEPKSASRLEEIKIACRQGSHARPDVIVSVGMISEGVDIPAIKVVVYMSAIITMLYLTQLLGRAMRRIFINGKYADPTPNRTLAYFVAPAHPYIMWFASEVENDIAEAWRELKSRGEPIDLIDEVEKKVPRYKTKVTGESAHICRNNFVEKVQLFGIIDIILNQSQAADFLVTTAWRDYLVSLIIDGKGKEVELVIKQKCQEMNLDYETISQPESIKRELTYDQQSKLASKDAQERVKTIRYKCEPYVTMTDDKAFPKVWKMLAGKAQIKKFPDATLEEKERFINVAENYIRESLRGV